MNSEILIFGHLHLAIRPLGRSRLFVVERMFGESLLCEATSWLQEASEICSFRPEIDQLLIALRLEGLKADRQPACSRSRGS